MYSHCIIHSRLDCFPFPFSFISFVQLCDPTDFISRKGITFEVATGRTAFRLCPLRSFTDITAAARQIPGDQSIFICFEHRVDVYGLRNPNFYGRKIISSGIGLNQKSTSTLFGLKNFIVVTTRYHRSRGTIRFCLFLSDSNHYEICFCKILCNLPLVLFRGLYDLSLF